MGEVVFSDELGIAQDCQDVFLTLLENHGNKLSAALRQTQVRNNGGTERLRKQMRQGHSESANFNLASDLRAVGSRTGTCGYPLESSTGIGCSTHSTLKSRPLNYPPGFSGWYFPQSLVDPRVDSPRVCIEVNRIVGAQLAFLWGYVP